jgi:hypothetical protein
MQASIVSSYFPDLGSRSLAYDVLAILYVNVANPESEAYASYHWRDAEPTSGFPTEVREFDFLNCIDDFCRVIDGGRRITGEESFDVITSSGQDLLLITLLHPMSRGTFDVYVNEQLVATRWIPDLAGYWLEVPTLLPSRYFTESYQQNHILIVPHVEDGTYMPFGHVIYAYGPDNIASRPEVSLSTFQNGAIVLSKAEINYEPEASQVAVNLDWYSAGNAQGDYVVFIHLYNEAGELVAQTDERPGDGTLPPGNWLPGIIHDTMEVDVSSIQPGRYQIAIGLYDPVTYERLAPSAGGDADNRLFVGEVEIPAHG